MSFQSNGNHDFLQAIELAGNPGTAGQMILSQGADTLPIWSNLISTDAANKLILGGDGLPTLNADAILAWNNATRILTFTNLAGTANTIDLSDLAVDVFTDSATLTGTTITFQPNDAGTATDFTIDLADFLGSFTGPVAGVYTYDDGQGNTYTIDVKDGISADANNDLTLGTDGLPFFTETLTTLVGMTAALPNQINYTDEAGTAGSLTLVSTDANNATTAGTDGKLFTRASYTTEAVFSAAVGAGEWVQNLTTGIHTRVIPATDFANANALAMFQVQRGAAAPFDTAFGLHQSELNADGSVTIQAVVPFAGRIVYTAS